MKHVRHTQPISVAERSKARVCDRSRVRIVGSNPTGLMDDYFLALLCVFSGLCDAPIPRPQEFNRLWCVVVCDMATSRMRRHLACRVLL